MVAMLLAWQVIAAACVPEPLRIRLTVGADQWRPAIPAIKAGVEQAWAPAGLRIDWIDHGEAWQDTDFWMAALPGMRMNGSALGGVQFSGNQPLPLARLSLDAVQQWVRRYRARLLGTTLRVLEPAAHDDVGLVTRVLGYAAAHELGHFVLATKSHASSGVMQAALTRPELMTDPSLWHLDHGNAKRLAERMSRACPSPALRAELKP